MLARVVRWPLLADLFLLAACDSGEIFLVAAFLCARLSTDLLLVGFFFLATSLSVAFILARLGALADFCMAAAFLVVTRTLPVEAFLATALLPTFRVADFLVVVFLFGAARLGAIFFAWLRTLPDAERAAELITVTRFFFVAALLEAALALTDGFFAAGFLATTER